MDINMLMVMIGTVIIVAIVLGVGNEMLRNLLRYKERQLEIMADKTAEQAARFASKSEQLEARVRVLERIATERGSNLALEIEDLRDRAADGGQLQ